MHCSARLIISIELLFYNTFTRVTDCLSKWSKSSNLIEIRKFSLHSWEFCFLMGQSRLLFLFIFVFSTCHNLNSNLIHKSIDGVLGVQTRGGRMEGIDESTELWRHPRGIMFLVCERRPKTVGLTRIVFLLVPVEADD